MRGVFSIRRVLVQLHRVLVLFPASLTEKIFSNVVHATAASLRPDSLALCNTYEFKQLNLLVDDIKLLVN